MFIKFVWICIGLCNKNVTDILFTVLCNRFTLFDDNCTSTCLIIQIKYHEQDSYWNVSLSMWTIFTILSLVCFSKQSISFSYLFYVHSWRHKFASTPSLLNSRVLYTNLPVFCKTSTRGVVVYNTIQWSLQVCCCKCFLLLVSLIL